MPKILIIAHRGLHKTARENTLEAFQKAIEAGADMIELDVRRTADGQLIVTHDPNISLLKTHDSDYHQLLEKARELGYHLPTLEETLALVQGKIKLDIELKEAGYEAEVVRLVTKYLPPQDFLITSFHHSCMRKIKYFNQQITTGLLIRDTKWGRVESLFISPQLLKFCDVILPHYSNYEFIKNQKKFLGKPMYVWTVNGPKEINIFLNDGQVAGVITDNLPPRQ